MYYPRFTKVIIHYFLTQDKTVSWKNKIGMHTSKDDYLINTLRFVSAKEATQIYGAILPESLTSPEMKETKAYKTYLSFATGATPPKLARKFKKVSPSKKDLYLNLVPVDEEPKPAKKKVPAKKITRKQTSGVVIRDTLVESSSKRKEKVDVARGKGIELLSEVALTEEAQMQEVRRKSMRDFHRTHPSGSGTVTEIPPSVEKLKPSVTSKGTGTEPGVPDVTKDESTKSEAESWGNDKDDSNNDHDLESDDSDEENDSDDENTQSDNKNESDSEHESEMGSESHHQENEEEVEDDKKEKEDEYVGTPSHYSPTDDEDETNVKSKVEDKAGGDEDDEMDYTTSLLYDDVDVRRNDPVHIDEGVSALEKEVVELKNDDPLKTQVTTLVDEHLDARLGATKEEFMSRLLKSITSKITKKVKIKILQILPKEESSQPQSLYEAATTLTEFELKKILIDKMDKSQSYLTASEHREYDKDKDEDPSTGSDRGLKKRKTSKDAEPTKGPKMKESKSGSSKGTKSQPKSSRKSVQSEEPEFEVANSDMPQDQEGDMGNDDEELKRVVPSKRPSQSWLMTLAAFADKPSKTFDDFMRTPIDFSAFIMNGLKINNLTQETLLGPAFKLLKGTHTNYAELEYDFKECYKALYLQGGVSTMSYTTSITKTKAAQYDLPGIKDMVPNIWKSRHDVYSMKRILAVTHVEVIRKHGYGYLKEIVVRRVDNDLYRFKEGDFPRLRINDIEDMLILVVQNRLTNLSGNDVFDFAIALRMFTRSLVIQKRVEDLQLRVESYLKKINVTKPETTRFGLRKRDPYTLYQDPQGFIYVNNLEINRLMRSDELYKFSDGTLTRLLSSLEDITKNINIEYLSKRR
ncbi:hypothetical protein Tco_0060973 [Tanacetum coccineum]